MKGTIKTLLAAKKFGFITGEDGIDRFFHRDSCADSVRFEALSEGDKVRFDPQDSTRGKGPRADRVELDS